MHAFFRPKPPDLPAVAVRPDSPVRRAGVRAAHGSRRGQALTPPPAPRHEVFWGDRHGDVETTAAPPTALILRSRRQAASRRMGHPDHPIGKLR